MAANSNLIDELYDKINEKNIILINEDTEEDEAVTIKDEVCKVYGILFDKDRFEDNDEEFCVLAHEYGHCKSGATHKLYSPYQLIGQHENRANRAAVHEFLPYEKLINAINKGNREAWQLAEYLDMPEPFIVMAMDIYMIEGKLTGRCYVE